MPLEDTISAKKEPPKITASNARTFVPSAFYAESDDSEVIPRTHVR